MITQEQSEAAGALVELIAGKIGADRAVHPETAVASAARLAGCLLLRSYGIVPEGARPGTAILSNEANEGVPKLIGIVSAMLKQFRMPLDQGKIGGEASMRGDPPELTVLESLALLQEDALRIAQENKLPLLDAASAAAIATGFIVKECAKDIGPDTGFNVAAYGFIEGCKTVPPEIEAASVPTRGKRPWYKLW
jgi:hypothetical protein